MTELQPPAFLLPESHPPDVFRRMIQSMINGEGVCGTQHLKVTAGSGMDVDVAAGEAFVIGDNRPDQGAYHVSNDATVTLTHDASDPTDDRIDLVVAQVYEDTEDSSGQNEWALEIVTGTPASSPSAPATPDNALVLAEVLVEAGASAVGTITDLRPLAVQRRQVWDDEDTTPAVSPGPSTTADTYWPTVATTVRVPAWATKAYVRYWIGGMYCEDADPAVYEMWLDWDGTAGEHAYVGSTAGTTYDSTVLVLEETFDCSGDQGDQITIKPYAKSLGGGGRFRVNNTPTRWHVEFVE